MFKGMPIFLAGVFSLLGYSLEGSVEIVGRATVEKAPEYGELHVRVTSVCYEKPLEAQAENAILSNRILEVLKKYIRTDQDEMTASGGHTLRQTEYTSDHEGKTKVLCERRWRTTNTLILKTNDLNSVSTIQDQVFQAMSLSEGINADQKQQTYAEMAQPEFFVYPKTFSEMKKEAQSKAWKDASSQFQVFLTECKLQNVRLAEITQPEYFRLAKATSLDGDTGTPVIPDAVSVYATWKFKWIFDPTPCFR